MVSAAELRKRILERILERPFQPFRIHLTDGRTFDVREPSWNLPAEAILLVGVAPNDDPQSRVPDRHERVEYQSISRVEPLIAS
jgi:hypothetical protein